VAVRSPIVRHTARRALPEAALRADDDGEVHDKSALERTGEGSERRKRSRHRDEPPRDRPVGQ
jgi:hypothetical protein